MASNGMLIRCDSQNLRCFKLLIATYCPTCSWRVEIRAGTLPEGRAGAHGRCCVALLDYNPSAAPNAGYSLICPLCACVLSHARLTDALGDDGWVYSRSIDKHHLKAVRWSATLCARKQRKCACHVVAYP
eukprot:6192520-Pleurochrysis_carterae.AAC.4